jgi:hypothetical protein
MGDNEGMETTTITANHDIEVGAIFEYSWGYDQTNVDYFEVIARTAKTVKIRKIGKETVDGSEGFMSCKVRPVPGKFVSERVFTKRPYLSTWRAENEWMLNFDFGIGKRVTADTETRESWYA